MGTELTISLVASELSVTRPAARKLLDKYIDVYFGGGFFAGDRKNRLPAKWWREQPKPYYLRRLEQQVV
jgi:hypothetical protein